MGVKMEVEGKIKGRRNGRKRELKGN